MTSITIPNSVTSIGICAFWGCRGLASINIPNSVTSIGISTFYGCTKLKEFIVSENNSAYKSVEGVLFSKDCTKLIAYPSAKSNIYTLPSSVTSIGNYAFYDCIGLTSVTIPNSVTSIGDYAFFRCEGLTLINIPNSVTSIGSSAFYDCTGFTSINIPNSVTSIGNSAFSYCKGLTSVTIPNSVTSIGDHAFANCTGLTSINIPNSVTSIGSSAFSYCQGLVSITIPNSVASIGIQTFIGCTKLKEFIVSENNPAYKSVEGVLFSKDCTELIACPSAKSNIYTLPNSVTSIGNYAFADCKGLTLVTIPNSVTSIGDHAFYYCTGLISVTMPNSVTSIGDGAFWGCTGLISVTIGNGVISIGSYAFNSCKQITEIHSKIQIPQNVNLTVFNGINKATCKLYVPKGTYSNYLNAIGWKDFTNIIEEEATAISQIEKSNVKVYTDQEAIIVTDADFGDNISVYTESGALLQTTQVTDNTIRITVPGNKIYFIRTAGKVFKVAL